MMNWSLVLNVFLLIGTVVAIFRTVSARRQSQEGKKAVQNPSIGQPSSNLYDDVIVVRKVDNARQPAARPVVSASAHVATAGSSRAVPAQPEITLFAPTEELEEVKETVISAEDAAEVKAPLMMFLLAKSNRQLAGYELLQAILSAGFRFGEGNLFHRHQHHNGQGPVMCSLAAATPTGVFDLQNIGGFVVHGLCLFIHVSGDSAIDAERFDMMMDAAKVLSEELDTHLLDDQREPLSEQSIQHYHQRLMLPEACSLQEA